MVLAAKVVVIMTVKGIPALMVSWSVKYRAMVVIGWSWWYRR